MVVMLHHFGEIDSAKVSHELPRKEKEWVLQEVQRVWLILPGKKPDGLGHRVKTLIEDSHFEHGRQQVERCTFGVYTGQPGGHGQDRDTYEV